LSHPVTVAAELILIEVFVLFVSGRRRLSPFFKFIPAVFWIYFLPMMASTAGILPAQSSVYPAASAYVLPASLVLLFLGADLPAIMKLGKNALIMMFSGSLGIILGGPVTLLLFRRWLPEDAWLGFGALSGSWVGGSANMVAAREILGTPDAVFLPMLVVDVVVSYSWMGLLILLAGFQKTFDRWNRSDFALIGATAEQTREPDITESGRRGSGSSRFPPFLDQNLCVGGLMILLAAGVTAIAMACSTFLPQTRGISGAAWTILITSIFAILLSLTPLKKLESYGASKIGYAMLYFVLTTMGARANLRDLGSVPVFILAGFVWVFFHFAFMLVMARLTRSPLALVATASQANIGGPVSAPIVAAVYQPSLAPVGLLLGILGNLIGTYAAILCAQLCRLAWCR
jgi:uncharacterized membrane protein